MLAVLCEASKKIDEAGFYEYTLKEKDYLFIDLSKGLTAFVLTSNPDFSMMNINSINETGADYLHTIPSGESSPLYGVKCLGGAANISAYGTVSLTVWVLSKEYCDGPSMVYSSPLFISDVFTSDSSAENFCMFFPNQGDAHFYIKQVPKATQTLTNFMVTKKDMSSISTDEFHDNLSSPFLVKFPKVNQNDEIRMDLTYDTNKEGGLCGSDFLVSVDGPVKGYTGIKTSKRYTTCDVSHYGEETQFIIIAVIFMGVLAGIAFFYFNGMCSSMTSSFRRLVGPASQATGMDVTINGDYIKETNNASINVDTLDSEESCESV